ncbi:MAG: C10 family peptidase [Bacteroidales bacterium]|nr:C10 family peptidase [Bacteroidales bacterium]
MKKTTVFNAKRFLLLLILLVTAGSVLHADPITPVRARQIAAEFVGTKSLQSVKRRRDVASLQESKPLYVFSRGENQGYVFVSGSDCLPEIIGYTDSGDFDEETASPQLLAYLDHFSRMAEAAEAQNLPARQQRKAAGTKNIKPLLTSHWHQTWPYNNMCPKRPDSNDLCLTGCVATAASQILYYWRKDMPSRTSYNTPTYNGWSGNADVTVSIPSGTPLKWDLMKDSYGSSDPKEYQDAAALLNYVIGTCDWMGYNASSGAYIWDLVGPFEKQFNMLSKEIRKNRDRYSQASWEKRIIQDLEKGYPIEYAGYQVEENGNWSGHAIVLDGYQINGNLFHFNFGWGGQGDGYYTVEEDGVNGFGVDQALVVDIHPKKPNLDGSILRCPSELIARMPNSVTVEVTNNSTLPYQGVYLYCLSGTAKLSASSTVTASDKETLIPVGESMQFTFDFTPTSTRGYTIYLADANKNVLAQTSLVTCAGSEAKLKLDELRADGSETETMTIEGKQVEVHRIYNTGKTNIYATLTNATDATLCAPTIKAEYCAYDPETGTFGSTVTKSPKTTVFQPGGTSTVEYNLPFGTTSGKLTEGTIFKFFLTGTAAASVTNDIEFEEGQNALYFKMMGNDMTLAEGSDSTECIVSGHYNEQAFSEQATDINVCRYDFTAVKGINSVPKAANSNALFYMNEEQNIHGTNVIVDGVADVLELTPGFSFLPKADFKALKAICHVSQGVGNFSTAILPFDCKVPDGMFARKIDEITTTSTSACANSNDTMLRGVPYVILSDKAMDLTAENVLVSVATPADQVGKAFKGTFVNQTAVSGNYLLSEDATPYFMAAVGQPIPALTGYMNATGRIRMSTSDLLSSDKKLRTLVQTVMDGLGMLAEQDGYAAKADMDVAYKVLAEAEAMITSYATTEEMNDKIKEIEAALALASKSSMKKGSNGFIDKTLMIANPSFEETTLCKGWTRTDSEGNADTKNFKSSNITTSLANYMSGADGSKVLIIQKGGYTVSQKVEGLPNGVYQLVVSASADYDQDVEVFAGDQHVTTVSSDFGPFYFMDVVVDDVKVEDGTLVIGASSVDANIKVDNFRLYLKEADVTDIILTPTSADERSVKTGVYDLSGRKLSDSRQLKSGIYVINGKKVMR